VPYFFLDTKSKMRTNRTAIMTYDIQHGVIEKCDKIAWESDPTVDKANFITQIKLEIFIITKRDTVIDDTSQVSSRIADRPIVVRVLQPGRVPGTRPDPEHGSG
jgi:hypothetical protein